MWTGREDKYSITHKNMTSLSDVARFYLSKSESGKPWYLSMNPDRMRTIFNECLERGRIRGEVESRIKKALQHMNELKVFKESFKPNVIHTYPIGKEEYKLMLSVDQEIYEYLKDNMQLAWTNRVEDN